MTINIMKYVEVLTNEIINVALYLFIQMKRNSYYCNKKTG